jgi:hypothetical protein
MKFEKQERYEFRRFGTNLTPIRKALEALGEGDAQDPSRETYIVTRLNIESNVKIQSNKLEVKGLKGRLQVLEQWMPVFKSKFPVDADDIEDSVAPALGIDLDLDGAGPFSEGALIDLMNEQPAVATVVVDKERTLYDLGDCEAEYTKLQIGDELLETVAIEAIDVDAAMALLQKVGLADADNESYSLMLQKRLFPTG